MAPRGHSAGQGYDLGLPPRPLSAANPSGPLQEGAGSALKQGVSISQRLMWVTAQIGLALMDIVFSKFTKVPGMGNRETQFPD